MRALLPLGFAVLITAGCNPLPDNCSQSLCGCYTETTAAGTGRVVSRSGAPISGATLVCVNDAGTLATSGADGGYAFSVSMSVSPGCGLQPCHTVTVSAAGFASADHRLENLSDAGVAVVLSLPDGG